MADVITRLKVESTEYDAKLKRASQGLLHFGESCQKAGKSMADADKETLNYVKSIGRMETTVKTAKGSLGEMTKAFTDMKMVYKQMTDQEKQSPVGKALSQSLEQLKTRIQDTKKELQGIDKELGGGSNVGKFGGMLDAIGQKMGITGNMTEMLTSSTALMTAGIGAATTAVVAATKAWSDYNTELARQQQITTVTTGLKGDDADNMTNAARALASTYGVDFREAVNAANTLMTQFGETGDEAISLLRDGMQGMIQGDGPKLLQMIQQYAPAFRDAGISASQLIAVIQNSEGGIFTDQNMNAIVMGIKNIRLMTKQTSEALAQLGIDGEVMTKKLNEGSMTIFEALKQVATQIKNVDSNSQAAGEVMQAVFGRQGAMAGTNLGEAIATLNTNLEETKYQTGEVGQSLADLEIAQEKLNKTMQDTFGMEGWDVMANKLKTDMVAAINDVLTGFQTLNSLSEQVSSDIKERFGGVYNVLKNVLFPGLGQLQGLFSGAGREGVSAFEGIKNAVMAVLGPLGTLIRMLEAIGKGAASTTIGSGGGTSGTSGTSGSVDSEIDKLTKETEKRIGTVRSIGAKAAGAKKSGGGKRTRTTRTPKSTGKRELTIQQQIAKLEEESYTASTARRDEIAKRVKELDKELERRKAIRDEIHGVVKVDKDLEAQEKKLAEAQNKLAEAQSTGSATAIYKAQEALNKQQAIVDRMKSSSKAGPERMTGMAALKYAVQGEVTFEQMKVDETTLRSLLKDAIKNGISSLDTEFDSLNEQIANGIDIPDEKWQEILDKYNEVRVSIGEDPIELDFKTGNIKNEAKKMKGDWKDAASAIQQVGQAMAGIEDPAAKVVGTVAQAIATVALGYAEATSEAGKQLGPWGWVAFAATGLAQMVSMISTIKSATSGYAEGGEIKGNTYSGDQIPIMANAGEIILNRAQAGNLASVLESQSQGGGGGVPYTTGEYVFLGVSNHLKRSGMGEIVTTSYLRQKGII